jgi:hypothetical protein
LLPVGGNVRDGRGTGCALASPQDLRQKGPEHDRRAEDVLLREQRVVPDESSLDALAGQNLGEGQTRLLKERFGDGVKSMIPWPSIGF